MPVKNDKLNFFQKISLETLWLLCRGFAVMPYWFRYYVMENVIFFVLRCLRYRMKVVKENLRNAFPEKSEAERNAICRKFYRTLSEMFVDTLSLAGMSDSEALDAVGWTNAEEHGRDVAGRDWIALAAHYGCWEYCTFWGLVDPTQLVVAVYHPLRNKIFEILYRRLRQRRNSFTVAMNDSLRFYMRNRGGFCGKNLVLGLIADQNPPRRPDSYWFKFLNQDTIFFDGGETLALKFNMPVYFVRTDRVRRGRYEITFEKLYDGEEELPKHEITERYVRHLEDMIVRCPELWMWSHRRWKHKK